MQYEASNTQEHLDLNIAVKEGHFITSTFFKETDRNAYIPVSSCHHKSWLTAVPKGQFQRIRHNCTEISEYYQQASIFRQRFIAKGYLENEINDIIVSVAGMDRCETLNKIGKMNPPTVNNQEQNKYG